MADTATRLRQLPDEIVLDSFALIIDASGAPAELIAKEFLSKVHGEFAKRYPLLLLFYDLELHETDVRPGSRKSRVHASLKRKKSKKPLLDTFLKYGGVLVIALKIASTDYGEIAKNSEVIRQTFSEVVANAEEGMRALGHRVRTTPNQE